MQKIILSLILIFNCNYVLALDTKEASEFGDSFIAAMQNGESVSFLPYQFHADTFLYNAFGEEYLNLTSSQKTQARQSLINSIKILHSSPILVMGYKQMNFSDPQTQSIGDGYTYNYISQIPGDTAREGGIYLMEIEDQIWITDIKSPNGWLTDFLSQGYQEMKEELSIPELMQLMEYKSKQEFDK